jgi:succinate dehydrogenase/fumarate reductase cytochrome b subunit
VTTSSATPYPEVKIIDHCTLIRYLLVITSYLLYALCVSLMALFTSGIVQGEYNFRVEEQRAITILVVWAATLLWGYWVLNGVRVMFIAVVAMLRAKQIKSAETSEPIDKSKGSEKLT